MNDGRLAANQEQGTKNQELPKSPAVFTSGFFCVLAPWRELFSAILTMFFGRELIISGYLTIEKPLLLQKTNKKLHFQLP
ncbi:MAG: hypothetical protein ACPHYF_09755 [Akkermansiaceae bacterium]